VTDTDTSHGPERRRYPRVNVQIPVELTAPGGAPLRTATQEISLCGCYIESLYTMDKGTKLSVALSLKDQVIRCNAVVARVLLPLLREVVQHKDRGYWADRGLPAIH
jgi:hypothetical protein